MRVTHEFSVLLEVWSIDETVNFAEHSLDNWSNEDGDFRRNPAIDQAGHKERLDRAFCIVCDWR